MILSRLTSINAAILVCCILFSTTAVCQSSFQSGYYITLSKDTVYGLVENRSEVLNSQACIYKHDKSSEAITFAPDAISGYRFDDGKYYVSKTVETKKGKEQVFVEFILDGIVDLFFYRDLENYFYLIENKDGRMLKLHKELETVFIEGKGEMYRDSRKHINMLKGAFSDCMEIQPQLERTVLTHKSLINMTKNYHNYVCEDEQCVIYEKKVPSIKVQFSPIIGYTASQLKLDGGFYSRFPLSNINQPSYGLQIHTIMPRVSEKISFQLDFLYCQQKTSGLYNGYYELFIDYSKLQPSFVLKYNIGKGKIRPNLGVGVAADFLLNPEYKAKLQNLTGSPTQPHELDDINMTSKLWGTVFQIGCNYKFLKKQEVFLNLKYTKTSGITVKEQVYTKTLLSSLNFNVGFYL